jgi:hypothetical protein
MDSRWSSTPNAVLNDPANTYAHLRMEAQLLLACEDVAVDGGMVLVYASQLHL